MSTRDSQHGERGVVAVVMIHPFSQNDVNDLLINTHKWGLRGVFRLRDFARVFIGVFIRNTGETVFRLHENHIIKIAIPRS